MAGRVLFRGDGVSGVNTRLSPDAGHGVATLL